MTAAAPTLTPRPIGSNFDPMKNKTYRQTALGPHIVDWLAWMELGGAADRTLDQYERDLSRAALMYPTRDLRDLTDGDLLHVVKSWPAASRRVRKAAIDSFFTWALRTRRITANPMLDLPAIKRTPQAWIDTFSDAEIEALVSLPLIDGALLMVMLDGGLRRSEARRLKVKHALPETGRIVVIKGKGSKDRVIPMTGRLKAALAELYLLHGLERDDHLWYDRPGGGTVVRRGRPIADGSFDRWWKRVTDAAGVRYRNPHTTRHSFATTWRRRGLDLDEIQKLLGHASIATTEALYVHTTVDDVAAHMALIEAAEA